MYSKIVLAVKDPKFLKELVDLVNGILELSSGEFVNSLPNVSPKDGELWRATENTNKER